MTKKKIEQIKELKIWFKGQSVSKSYTVGDTDEDLFDLVRSGFEDNYLYFLDESDSSIFINMDDVSVVKYEGD